MKVFLKYLLKNIAEKKLRTFLIIFSIIISTALFFASNAIAGTLQEMYLEQLRRPIGTSDIIIYPSELSPTPFFDIQSPDTHNAKIDYQIGSIEVVGVYTRSHDRVIFNVKGFHYPDLQTLNPVYLSSEAQGEMGANSIVISQRSADKYGFRLGDTIKLELGNSEVVYTLYATAHPAGFFAEDTQTVNAIIVKESLAQALGIEKSVNRLYIKLSEGANADQTLTQLGAVYDGFEVVESISKEDVQRMVNSIADNFRLMALVVLFISMFIIYTSFKLIAIERLPVTGTFRSIGATSKMTGAILVAESIIYGVIGGLLGCMLGIGILYLMAINSAPPWMDNMKTLIRFTPAQLLFSFSMAVVISFISAWYPVHKTSKIPVKDIILNTTSRAVKFKRWRPIAGVLLLIPGMLLSPVTPRSIGLLTSMVSLFCIIFAIILLVPTIIHFMIRPLNSLYQILLGNLGSIAVKNLRGNKSIQNSVTLLAIGIACLLLINILSYSVIEGITSLYQDVDVDITFSGPGMNNDVRDRLEKTDGISLVYGNYRAMNVDIVSHNTKINSIEGITDKYTDIVNIDLSKEQLQSLNNERTILITNFLKEKHSLNIGDTLSLKLKQSIIDYEVAGFFDTLMSNGNIGFIGDNFFKEDMDYPNYEFFSIIVQPGTDVNEMAEKLRKDFLLEQPIVKSLAEEEAQNKAMNMQMFGILRGFSIMTLVIGIFGILNNLLISYIERRRQLAVLRSIGMSRRQIAGMLIIESLTGGFIGGILGTLGGVLMLINMPYLMLALNVPIDITYSPDLLIISLISGIAIMIISTITPALKSSKQNIIASIKYE